MRSLRCRRVICLSYALFLLGLITCTLSKTFALPNNKLAPRSQAENVAHAIDEVTQDPQLLKQLDGGEINPPSEGLGKINERTLAALEEFADRDRRRFHGLYYTSLIILDATEDKAYTVKEAMALIRSAPVDTASGAHLQWELVGDGEKLWVLIPHLARETITDIAQNQVDEMTRMVDAYDRNGLLALESKGIAVVPTLIKIWVSESIPVRLGESQNKRAAAAAFVLGQIGDKRARTVLKLWAKEYDDDDGSYSKRWGLAMLGDEGSMDFLLEKLRMHTNLSLVQMGLVRIGEPAVPALIEKFMNRYNPLFTSGVERDIVAKTLIGIGGQNVIDKMKSFIYEEMSDYDSAQSHQRVLAVKVLGSLGDDDSVLLLLRRYWAKIPDFNKFMIDLKSYNEELYDRESPILQELDDEIIRAICDVAVRVSDTANWGSRSRSDPDPLAILTHEFAPQDTDELRLHIWKTLQNVSDRRPFIRIIPYAVKDRYEALRHDAIRLLVTEEGLNSVSGLMAAMAGSDPFMRKEVFQKILDLGHIAVPALIAEVERRNASDYTAEAAIRLGQLGVHEAVPHLVRLLNHGTAEQRIAAAKALGQIRDTKATDSLIERLISLQEQREREHRGLPVPEEAILAQKEQEYQELRPVLEEAILATEKGQFQNIRALAANHLGTYRELDFLWIRLVLGDIEATAEVRKMEIDALTPKIVRAMAANFKRTRRVEVRDWLLALQRYMSGLKGTLRRAWALVLGTQEGLKTAIEESVREIGSVAHLPLTADTRPGAERTDEIQTSL